MFDRSSCPAWEQSDNISKLSRGRNTPRSSHRSRASPAMQPARKSRILDDKPCFMALNRTVTRSRSRTILAWHRAYRSLLKNVPQVFQIKRKTCLIDAHLKFHFIKRLCISWTIIQRIDKGTILSKRTARTYDFTIRCFFDIKKL